MGPPRKRKYDDSHLPHESKPQLASLAPTTMLDLVSGRPAKLLHRRLLQLSCPESSLALTRLDSKDRALIREFITAYMDREPTDTDAHAFREKSEAINRELNGKFQFVIDFMRQSPAVDIVSQMCCEGLDAKTATRLNEIKIDSNDGAMRDLRKNIVGAFEKPPTTDHGEHELVWSISRFVSGLQEDQVEVLRDFLETPHWANTRVICDASHAIDDHVSFFTQGSGQLKKLYRQIKKPVNAPLLQHYRHTAKVLRALPRVELSGLWGRLDINGRVDKEELSELQDEVRDKLMDCNNKVGFEAYLEKVYGRNITDAQIAQAVELVGRGSKNVRRYVRECSRKDLIDLSRALDLANKDSISQGR